MVLGGQDMRLWGEGSIQVRRLRMGCHRAKKAIGFFF